MCLQAVGADVFPGIERPSPASTEEQPKQEVQYASGAGHHLCPVSTGTCRWWASLPCHCGARKGESHPPRPLPGRDASQPRTLLLRPGEGWLLDRLFQPQSCRVPFRGGKRGNPGPRPRDGH